MNNNTNNWQPWASAICKPRSAADSTDQEVNLWKPHFWTSPVHR